MRLDIITDLFKRYRRYMLLIACILINLWLSLPSIRMALLTYPVQDDYYNTVVISGVMSEKGYGPFFASLWKAITGYFDYSGYYTSLFLTYFTDAIVKCDIGAIRVIQMIMLITFYVVVYAFLKVVLKQVFKLKDGHIDVLAVMFFVCITCLPYYAEHEDYYWFCASVIYLIPLTIILLMAIFAVLAIDTGKKRFIPLAVICGFLGGGAVLNVAAFGCITGVMVAYWGIAVRNRTKLSIGLALPITIGGFLNVISPGNFKRNGAPITFDVVCNTFVESIGYAGERIKLYVLQNPLYIGIVLTVFFIALSSRRKEQNEGKYYVPALFTVVMYFAIVILIFPVVLAYGIDCYAIMCRANYISDFAIFAFSMLVAVYWAGWINKKDFRVLNKKNSTVALVALAIVVFAISLLKTNTRWLGSVRMARELRNGQADEFAKWNEDIIMQMENCEDDIIEIHTTPVEDRTCLINPLFYYGYYDSDVEFGNKSIALFYGKKAVYIYDDSQEEN